MQRISTWLKSRTDWQRALILAVAGNSMLHIADWLMPISCYLAIVAVVLLEVVWLDWRIWGGE